jgi:hypothetical protein
MAYAIIDGTVGAPQIQLAGLTVDTVPRVASGFIADAVDPYWGAGRFIYARAAGAIRAFGLCVLTPVFDSTLNTWRYDATEVPNTANLGRELVVS